MFKTLESWEKPLKDDKWPKDIRQIAEAVSLLSPKDVPRPHVVLQEILDIYLASEFAEHCEGEDEEAEERDCWHPLRNTQGGLARQLGVSREHLNAMVNSRSPVGLKFAKALYTWCRKTGLRREAWRLRLSYDFWGAKGDRNPLKVKMGGTRKPMWPKTLPGEYRRKNLKNRYLREQLLLEAQLAEDEKIKLKPVN